MSSLRIRIGTRGSPLARWQAEWVAARLTSTDVEVALVPITTQGDWEQRGSIAQLGETGVFTKEIERALLDQRIDLAVHSLKDLPTEGVAELCLAAVPPREAAGDALVSRERQTWSRLFQGAAVGTGSLRRQAQLLHARPDLHMHDIRGNVETRLRKLEQGQYDAIVLAEAGLRRLGLQDAITQVLPKSLILPAIGQGALGLQTRRDDEAVRDVVAALDDPATHQAVTAERTLLATLRGGCLAPVGAWGRIEADGQLHLTAAVLSRDGRRRVDATGAAEAAAAEVLGRHVAEDLLAQGAADLIATARQP